MVKPNIVIRNYRKSDYEDTLDILKELNGLYGLGVSEDKWRESSGLRQFKPNLKRLTIIAELDGKVVSMGIIQAKKDTLGQYVGHLDTWATKKEYIGKGIGKVLADKAIQILKSWGVDKVQIQMAYQTDKKLIDTICKGSGLIPKYIVLEKAMDESEEV